MKQRPSSARKSDSPKGPIPKNRRRFLRATAGTVAVGFLGGLAGCAGLGGGNGRLTARVINEDEISHEVGVTVTDEAGDVVEETPREEIQPGVSQEFTSDGYADGEYQVAVTGEGKTAWKQATRWTNLDSCLSLVFEVRLTRTDGNATVTGSDECEQE
jgi:hypothetical protein